jgi:hypothetical protein
MLRERILDDLQQCGTVIPRLDFHLVQQLHHEPSESLVCSRDSNTRVYINQDFAFGMNVDFEQASLVQGTVQQSQHLLMQNVGPEFIRITTKFLLAQVTMIITI